MNDLFRVNVQLNETIESPYNYAGVLRITPSETVQIEQIRGELVMRVKGKMESQSHIVDSFIIKIEDGELLENETYEFPFQRPRKTGVVSYKGRNVGVFFELKFSTNLEKETYKRVNKNIIKRVGSFLTGITDYNFYTRSVVFKPQSNYNLIERDHRLEINLGSFLIIAMFSMFFMALGMILFGVPQINDWDSEGFLLLLGIGLCIFFGYMSQSIFFAGLLGEFFADIKKKDDENFMATVRSTSNWRYISAAKTYYEIEEEVIDRRGTSTSTYTEKLYSSKPIEIYMMNSREEIMHSFPPPSRTPPAINEIDDVSIKWIFVLEVTTIMNLTLNYRKVICD